VAPPLFLRAIEESPISSWIRDSPSPFAYWFILTIHAIGMGVLVGASTVLDLRLLGVARDLPIAPLKRLYPIMWFGFWMQVASGLLLMIAFPTKALTNPVFYTKLVLIAFAMTMMAKLYTRIFNDSSLNDDQGIMRNGRSLAKWSLICWAAAMTAGRFLAYTAKYLVYPGR
jgi:hypothetical protein